jgi:hypothetical protein
MTMLAPQIVRLETTLPPTRTEAGRYLYLIIPYHS